MAGVLTGAHRSPTAVAGSVSEWLRSRTRNPMGSARGGSNPLAVAFAIVLLKKLLCDPAPTDARSSLHLQINPVSDPARSHARLAQLVERKALNLVVVGSSPTVGVFDLW